MAWYRQDFEKLGKELVLGMTDFSESDDNFKICLDFALSNFKHHRFLDVDSHKITKAVDGINHKFRVHSQDKKSEAFQQLVRTFLDSPVYEDSDHGKTDTHYSLLSLLLLLAQEPTAVPYHVREKTPEEVEEDNFDWKGYLLEGEDPIRSFREDSDSDIDWEEDVYNVAKATKHVQLIDPSIYDPDDESVANVNSSSVEDTGEKSALKNQLIDQYWQENVGYSLRATNRDSSLVTELKAYLSDTTIGQVLNEKHVVTEYQINREFLWLLSGIQESYVFLWNGDEFIPNQDIQVVHLSQQTLRKSLLLLAHYGTVVQKLQSFIESVTYHQQLPVTARVPCQTDEAYAAALAQYLQNFKKELVILERNVTKQDDVLSVAAIVEKLRIRLEEVQLLGHVYEEGMYAYLSVSNNSLRASHLLGTIYKAMLEYNTLSDDRQNCVCLLLSLWVKSVKPYLDMVDHWIAHGTLQDPHKEFIVERNHEVKTQDENYWFDSLILHCPGFSSAADDEQDLNKTSSEYSTPSFIVPVIEQIVLAGKSTELLRDLGKLQDIADPMKRGQSLHQMFMQSVKEFLCKSLDEKDGEIHAIAKSERESIIEKLHASITEVRGLQDPLLQLNFIKILNPMHCTPGEINRECTIEQDSLRSESLPPMQLLLQKCLYPHVTTKKEQVCSKLLEILKSEHRLVENFAAMRHFHLMEAGDTMYDFYTELFERIRLGESWRDVSFLNTILQDALQAHFSWEMEKLCVFVDDMENKPCPASVALEGVHLHYGVTWPVNYILNSRCMVVYNKVFSFLLQIKWVKYSLDQLRFQQLSTGGSTELKHRMLLFRMRLMHFVNSLHNYLMTRILHSTGLEFQHDLENAHDLDQVLNVHNAYIAKIHQRCLLHKKISFIREVVGKILNLAIYFRGRWEQGPTSLTLKGLGNLEAEFSRCKQFLSSFLNNAIKRGSFPHLESLAFALITTPETTTSSGQ